MLATKGQNASRYVFKYAFPLSLQHTVLTAKLSVLPFNADLLASVIQNVQQSSQK